MLLLFISNNYYIYLKRYFEIFVTHDFFSKFWRTAALSFIGHNGLMNLYYLILKTAILYGSEMKTLCTNSFSQFNILPLYDHMNP